ncbi:MAG: peroxiredoxin [Alphaproteobacteria bacterium]
MTIKAGDRIPSTKLRHMTADGPAEITTDDFFKGRKVVLFAVPGAFTPTCSARHLPGFVEKSDAFRGKGVDAVACVAVNDVFVMDAWGKSQNCAGKVEMLSDGNGELARALDLELDASKGGLGVRSKRYAMIVDDGVVKEVHVEAPGAFEVSSADYVLGRL